MNKIVAAVNNQKRKVGGQGEQKDIFYVINIFNDSRLFKQELF
jgi:hypothetical protein